VWWFNVGSVVAGTGRRELKAVDGEWEVLIIWIVDEESVVDALLQALGLVAFGHQWAGVSWGGALFDAGSLGEGFVVGLDVVDHDPPLAVDVDGTEGLDIGSLGGAEVSLLDNVLQASHRVVRVGKDVLVHLLDGVVVVLDGLLDLVGGVLFVLKTPWLGVVNGALGWAVGRLLVRVVWSGVVGVVNHWVVGHWVVGHWVVDGCGMVDNGMVDGGMAVGDGLGVNVGRGLVVRGGLVVGSWLMVWSWLMVGSWGVWGRAWRVAIGGWGWGVTVGRVGSLGRSSHNEG